MQRHLYSRFPKVGISLFVVLQLVLFGVPAITMLAAQLMAQPFFAGGVINGLGRHVGYRSFELPTAATNIVPAPALERRSRTRRSTRTRGIKH